MQVSLFMEKILSNLFTKILKKESKCHDIINIPSLIGKIVHSKDNFKSVLFQDLLNKLNSKLLVEFSLKNPYQNQIKINNQKMMSFD